MLSFSLFAKPLVNTQQHPWIGDLVTIIMASVNRAVDPVFVEEAVTYSFDNESLLVQALNGTGNPIRWNGHLVGDNKRLAIYGDVKMKEHLCRRWLSTNMTRGISEIDRRRQRG
jgi:hypothetical protein